MSNNTSLKILGWNFDNSYLNLPSHCFTKVHPTPVSNPEIVIFNKHLADELGLLCNKIDQNNLAKICSGNIIPAGADPIAQAYAGHQFGNFTILGDGRAHFIGEHITPNNLRVDIQLKGSGKTPYSRRGDGRAALGPMLREYIISEAMHALKIPTTRSLAVVATGEPVLRDTILQGAILTRVAASHLRVGTFEYFAQKQDITDLKQLADYAINRHYPDIKQSDQPYVDFIKAIMQKQIDLIINWLRVGFIHGVMNTDNMAISGETIDYGPCAFMDAYDPHVVFSSIDHTGRYAYANQPNIAKWNLARLSEALLPLLHDNIKQAAGVAGDIIQSFNVLFQKGWLSMMRQKLGLFGQEKEDEQIISELLKLMQTNHMDYTNTFREIISTKRPEGKLYNTNKFKEWWDTWQSRLQKNSSKIEESFNLMRNNNPVIIPRNHHVEEALINAEENNNFKRFEKLLNALLNPYDDKHIGSEFYQPPKPEQRIYQTFCGT